MRRRGTEDRLPGGEFEMKHLLRYGTALAVYVAMVSPAHAVFSAPAPLPEPGSLGLLVMGGIAIAAVRYLTRRKDKRDE
jgi:hypothetical protein